MTEASTEDEGLLTAAQVAGMLNVHTETVLRYVRAGTLKCYRVGPRYIRFTTAQVADFINRKQGK